MIQNDVGDRQYPGVRKPPQSAHPSPNHMRYPRQSTPQPHVAAAAVDTLPADLSYAGD